MRKWHRWLSVFFGVFMLWIAVTGVASQIVPLMAGEAPRATTPADFVCPQDYICRPKQQPGDPRALVGTLHDLHSGESFGAVGTAISILSGLALMFFSISGIWLYVQMWRNRKDRGLRADWFWK